MPRSRAEIRDLLKAHQAQGGCANECVVTDWYREWYRLDPEVEVELEMQERWANDVVQGVYDKQLTRGARGVP